MFLSEQSSLTLFIWVTRFARVSREIEGQHVPLLDKGYILHSHAEC